MRAELPVDDGARVAALRALGVLDQPPTPDLDAITRLATAVTGAPVAVLNLIDADRQVQASVAGGEPGVFAREDSLCQHTVAEGRLIHVSDASADRRFADSPFVNGVVDDIRLYCGVPVRDGAGFAVGSLCVVGNEPRELTPGAIAALEDLAAQVGHLFELRRQRAQMVEMLSDLQHLADHDPLTGLANGRTLRSLMRDTERAAPSLPAVFYCDLDGFKAVNDTFGHDVGDEVLVEIARRLRAAVRPSDVVARVGGDEFVLLCDDLNDESVPAVEARIRATTREPVLTRAGAVRVGVSVGLSRAAASSSLHAVLADADRRMYADKRARRAIPVVARPVWRRQHEPAG
ncbi:MAG TPA: sensor domain-containing diguanylate cyclase [Jatrophihabitans sp.]|uniref:GGDEF domain-containing protein n=1 Tax=Jatrophihabitans sp. TaxID=1932789 RepID=UPI002E04BCD6|nr:sensor domain-containing diguanylate cyclase [Jatrophihabitans sp.]